LNEDDLRWQIRQQLGAPRSRPINEKPDQEAVNSALLHFAQTEGRLKQGDDRAEEMLDKLNASYDQKRKAFRALPEEYRYSRGRPSAM
jgi:hypothetical protein